jgi:hypothetical protein
MSKRPAEFIDLTDSADEAEPEFDYTMADNFSRLESIFHGRKSVRKYRPSKTISKKVKTDNPYMLPAQQWTQLLALAEYGEEICVQVDRMEKSAQHEAIADSFIAFCQLHWPEGLEDPKLLKKQYQNAYLMRHDKHQVYNDYINAEEKTFSLDTKKRIDPPAKKWDALRKRIERSFYYVWAGHLQRFGDDGRYQALLDKKAAQKAKRRANQKSKKERAQLEKEQKAAASDPEETDPEKGLASDEEEEEEEESDEDLDETVDQLPDPVRAGPVLFTHEQYDELQRAPQRVRAVYIEMDQALRGVTLSELKESINWSKEWIQRQMAHLELMMAAPVEAAIAVDDEPSALTTDKVGHIDDDDDDDDGMQLIWEFADSL